MAVAFRLYDPRLFRIAWSSSIIFLVDSINIRLSTFLSLNSISADCRVLRRTSNWKGFVRKRSQPNPGIFVEGLRIIAKELSQGTRCPRTGSDGAHPTEQKFEKSFVRLGSCNPVKVSDEHVATIFMVEEYGNQNNPTLSSKTSLAFQRTTRQYIGLLHSSIAMAVYGITVSTEIQPQALHKPWQCALTTAVYRS
jgi:hypothetical protein